MNPQEITSKLVAIYQEKLDSVLLYGSAANGRDYSKKYSDYNLLVVLQDVSPSELSRSSKIVQKWMRKGNPVPLFFTLDHFKTSADVFPIEFLDIQQQHKVLAGKNPLERVVVHKLNLRHECESELRGKLLFLRQQAALHGAKPKKMMDALLTSFPTFIAVFRGILHLLDETPRSSAEEVIEQLEKRVVFSSQPFFDLAFIRERKASPPSGNEVIVLFERYLTELTAITNFVDEFKDPQPKSFGIVSKGDPQ